MEIFAFYHVFVRRHTSESGRKIIREFENLEFLMGSRGFSDREKIEEKTRENRGCPPKTMVFFFWGYRNPINMGGFRLRGKPAQRGADTETRLIQEVFVRIENLRSRGCPIFQDFLGGVIKKIMRAPRPTRSFEVENLPKKRKPSPGPFFAKKEKERKFLNKHSFFLLLKTHLASFADRPVNKYFNHHVVRCRFC